MNKRDISNLFILAGKILGPIIKLLLKLLKTAKVIKVGLVAGSVVAYAYMFTWQFALIIMGFLFVHEYGHVWAMKQKGIKTRGMYFIPFLGAAAVTEGEFKSYQNEVYTALMGPIWGIVLAFISWGLYEITGNVLFAGSALWMFMCTIFNLLPIMPLDGGRILRCIAMSFSTWGGLILFVVSTMLSILFLKKIGLGLILFFVVIGGCEVIIEMCIHISKIRKIKYLTIFLTVKMTNTGTKKEENYKPATQSEIYQATRDLKELTSSLKPGMPRKSLIISFISLLLVAGICLGSMYMLRHTPGATMALDILQDKKEIKKGK